MPTHSGPPDVADPERRVEGERLALVTSGRSSCRSCRRRGWLVPAIAAHEDEDSAGPLLAEDELDEEARRRSGEQGRRSGSRPDGEDRETAGVATKDRQADRAEQRVELTAEPAHHAEHAASSTPKVCSVMSTPRRHGMPPTTAQATDERKAAISAMSVAVERRRGGTRRRAGRRLGHGHARFLLVT